MDRRIFDIGEFRVDGNQRRLFDRAGDPVSLTARAFDVLMYMVQRPGELLDKNSLIKAVWPETVVEENNLTQCIFTLRRALGESAGEHRYIVTVPGRGYQFVARVAAVVHALPTTDRAPPDDPATIAVLPFADMSPDRDQDYLCEGLAAELIDALTHIDGLRVAARTSTFQFRDFHDLREVGRRLGVGWLLEGSVRKSGDRLRVTVQMIDVVTGYHKWSEKFDRSALDVFAVEEEIAETVTRLLRGNALTQDERRSIHRQPTAIETYECFLRGRQRMHSMQQPHMDEARGFFERAISLDAEYAPAWAGLAMLHALLFEWWGSNDVDLKAADRASRMAMKLAPELADAHMARAYTLSNMGGYDEACKLFEAAVRINPNLFDAYYYYGRAAFAAGETEKSIELWRRGGSVRRDDFECPFFEGQSLRKLGLLDEARNAIRESVRRAERLLEVNPHDARVLSLGSAALHLDGQERRALEWALHAEKLSPGDIGVVANSAMIHARLGRKDAALDRLERIFSKGWGKRRWIENDPDYDVLRDEPRFRALLEKLR
jgi:adenylate cyclase